MFLVLIIVFRNDDNMVGSASAMSIRRMRSHTDRCVLRVWDIFPTSKQQIFRSGNLLFLQNGYPFALLAKTEKVKMAYFHSPC